MSRVSLPVKQAYQAKLQLRRDVRDYEQYFYIYPVGLCCHNETKFTSDLKVVKEIVGLFNERCLILKLFLHTKMSNCHSINQSINQLSIFLTQSSYLFLTIRKLSSWNKRKSIYILYILKDIQSLAVILRFIQFKRNILILYKEFISIYERHERRLGK